MNSIGEFVFNGSEIGVLLLSGNKQLTSIHENAFANLKNLVKLDLSGTSISQLPSSGLQQLSTLIMRDTFTLKRIPSIYVFPALREAHLTYAYHCCSFRHPETHDPEAHEQHLKLQAEINSFCENKRGSTHTQDGVNWASWLQPSQVSADASSPTGSEFEGIFGTSAVQTTPMTSTAPTVLVNKSAPELTTTTSVKTHAGLAHADLKSRLNIPYNIECGELVKYAKYHNVTCTPEPDAFNPCEDIMGYPILRVAVWFVVAASVFGNMSVIVVILGVFKRMTVPKFLQMNLAIGDMMMGVYLTMLALADLSTIGSYFNYAIDWQHGYGCKVAGAASLFASQLSIFSLSVITFERYYTITYSIDLNMRLQLGWAARIMLVGWLYAFASAMLPVFADVNSYSKTSICLPLRTKSSYDRIFILVLLIIDSGAFVIIFACYLRMYLLILRQKTEATAKERTVAMRMALLVSTDFACWAPIIFFGTTALFGRPLISVTNSKILIVFFYPLNSMANPFLYVLSTRQYHRDLDYLRVRLTLWRKNLFKKSGDDSYYSNNAYVAGINMHPGALNVHLGAVAALTGAATHLHGYQLTSKDTDTCGNKLHDGSIAWDQNSDNRAVKMHDQRVGCPKGHKGHYIIRHQILTSRRSHASAALMNNRPNNKSRSSLARRQQQQQQLPEAGDSSSPKSSDAFPLREPSRNRLRLSHVGCETTADGAGKKAPPPNLKQPLATVSGGESSQVDGCDDMRTGAEDESSAQVIRVEPGAFVEGDRPLELQDLDARNESPKNKCCRCCAHLCRFTSSRSRASQATSSTAQTTRLTKLTVSDQAAISHSVDRIEEIASSGEAKNLCRTAREAAELKSIALVNPMPKDSLPVASAGNSAGTRRGQFSSLVDDIFRETFASDSRRVSEHRKSIDILGNLSFGTTTTEPNSSTSGVQDQAVNYVVGEFQKNRDLQLLQTHEPHQQSSHRHHRHHHHQQYDCGHRQEHRHPCHHHGHHHHRRCRHSSDERLAIRGGEIKLLVEGKLKVRESKCSPTGPQSRNRHHRRAERRNHNYHHHHYHHGRQTYSREHNHTHDHHHVHLRQRDKDGDLESQLEHANEQPTDHIGCKEAIDNKNEAEKSPEEMVDKIQGENNETPTHSMPKVSREPPKELGSILKTSKLESTSNESTANSKEVKKDTLSLQRISSLIGLWMSNPPGKTGSSDHHSSVGSRRLASSLRSTPKKEKKRVSIVDHHSG